MHTSGPAPTALVPSCCFSEQLLEDLGIVVGVVGGVQVGLGSHSVTPADGNALQTRVQEASGPTVQLETL